MATKKPLLCRVFGNKEYLSCYLQCSADEMSNGNGFTQHIAIVILPMLTGNENQLRLLFHHILENAFIHGTKENHLEINVEAFIVKENIFNSLEGRYL